MEVGLRRPPEATVLRAAAAASDGIEAAMARNPGRENKDKNVKKRANICLP